jgi:hypothetical protein
MSDNATLKARLQDQARLQHSYSSSTTPLEEYLGWEASARIAELEAAHEITAAAYHASLHRLAELEAERDKAREAGHEEVLAFIRGGHFLHPDAPTARFAREVEAGWKSWGKAQAEKNRANHGSRVADAPLSQEALVGSRGEEPSALPSPTEEDGV